MHDLGKLDNSLLDCDLPFSVKRDDEYEFCFWVLGANKHTGKIIINLPFCGEGVAAHCGESFATGTGTLVLEFDPSHEKKIVTSITNLCDYDISGTLRIRISQVF